MYFHIIGIKEVDNQKYNINIVLESKSISIAKDFLRQKNIIILDINQYKDNIDKFGNIEFLLRDSQVFRFFYSGKNLLNSIKYFLKLDFPISYANFLSTDKLPEYKVLALIEQANSELIELDEITKYKASQKKLQTTKVFKNEKLIKITNIAYDTITQVDQFLAEIDLSQISADKIRDLKLYYQDLNKLKMSRNLDKMVEVLASIYQKIYELQREYLSKQDSPFVFSGSIVTDSNLTLEYHKYQKAQKIKHIGAKRDRDDAFYLSFEKTGLFFKLLLKDIKNIFQNISKLSYILFDYLDFFFVFSIIAITMYVWFNEVSYSIYYNFYVYHYTIKIGLFAFVFSIAKIFRKKRFKSNIGILIISIILSYILFFLTRNNLSF